MEKRLFISFHETVSSQAELSKILKQSYINTIVCNVMVMLSKCLVSLQCQDLRRVILILARIKKPSYKYTGNNSIFKVQKIFLKSVLAYQEKV